MATNKRVIKVRLNNEIFDKVELLAKSQHRSRTKQIEYLLREFIDDYEKKHGPIKVEQA